MKKLEEIEEEYKIYNPKTLPITTQEEFQVYIEILLGEIRENKETTRREIKYNRRWKYETKIKNYFLVLINQREVDVYDLDTKILKEMVKLDEEYESYFERMLSIANEKNIQKLVKLAEFAKDYYKENEAYLDTERESLELELRGIHMFSSNHKDTRKQFKEFIEKHLKLLEEKEKTTKQYVKRGN